MRSDLFKIELRRGPGRWAAGLSVVLFYVALHRYGVVLTWMDATSAIGASTQLAGPAAAGVAVYAGSRAVRHRTMVQQRLAARAELATTGSELAAFVLWVVGAWLLAAAVTLLAVWHHCHWGYPSFVWILASGAGLVAEIAVGYLAGRLLPYLITPPIVAIALFFGTGLMLTHANTWWYFLGPLDSQDWLPFDGLQTTNFAIQSIFLVGVAVTALAGAAIRLVRSDRAGLLAFAVAFTVTLLAAGGLASGNGRFWAIDIHIVWTCTGASPTVCVHPAFAAVKAPLDEQLSAMAARTAGTPFATSRFEQRPRGIGSEPTPGAQSFAIDQPIPAAVPDAIVGAAVSLLNADSCGLAAKLSSARVEQTIVEWVSGQAVLGPDQSMPDPAADTIVNYFKGLSDPAKRAWLTQHAQAIRTCSFVVTERR